MFFRSNLIDSPEIDENLVIYVFMLAKVFNKTVQYNFKIEMFSLIYVPVHERS